MDAIIGSASQLLGIIWLNAILSGDNAIVIGMAAAGLPAEQRARAILWGIVAAAVLRIVFSIFATYLLEFWWIDILGGLALLYIAWDFFRELRAGHAADEGDAAAPAEPKSMAHALRQIIIADVSMSLDNVLAVAAIARTDLVLLTIGLLISIVMMGLLGGFLARVIERYRIIAHVGVALIVWIGLKLLEEGLERGDEALGLGWGLGETWLHQAPVWLTIAGGVAAWFWLRRQNGTRPGAAGPN